jgi:hypothetical protein
VDRCGGADFLAPGRWWRTVDVRLSAFAGAGYRKRADDMKKMDRQAARRARETRKEVRRLLLEKIAGRKDRGSD